MHKRYCKTNTEDYIYDLFFEHQKNKFDGTEKYLDEVESPANVYINDKIIYDESGTPLFKYNNGVPIEAVDNIKLLEYYKKEKVKEIKNAFENEFVEGHFASTALGIEVDCRRSGTRNDLQNVNEMIDNYDYLPEKKKYFKGLSETTTFKLTLDQCKALKLEMFLLVANRYAKKDELLEQIENATIETIKNIKW